MRSLIAMHGWAVQGVERDGIHPPWAYTVGLTPHRRPELVVTGLGLNRATEVLNGVAAHLLHAEAPEPGTRRRCCSTARSSRWSRWPRRGRT